jgi:hypothetical protein
VFIIHKPLVSELLDRFVRGECRPILVGFPSLSLCDRSVLISQQSVSKNILIALGQERGYLVVILDEISHLPSTAGLLLSYPAIYYSEDSHSRLLDADLNVISVRTDGQVPRVLMQFSCPPDLLDEVTKELKSTVAEWESRSSQLSPPLRDKWREFTGVESCTLKIQVETRRVPVLSL